MTKTEFEIMHDVRLIPKSRSRLMRLAGVFLGSAFMTDFWTTYRVPFAKPVISYPDDTREPMRHTTTLDHELVHVGQLRPWYGPFLLSLLVTVFPLPFFFSGRWYIERPAYLNEIKNNIRELDDAVDILWNDYGWCWPKPLMRRWFQKHFSSEWKIRQQRNLRR